MENGKSPPEPPLTGTMSGQARSFRQKMVIMAGPALAACGGHAAQLVQSPAK